MKSPILYLLICLPFLALGQNEGLVENSYQQALQLYQQARFTESKVICEQWVPRLKSHKDKIVYVDFLLLYASNQRLLNEFEAARSTLDHTREIFLSRKTKKGIRHLKLLNSYSMIYYHLGDCQNMKQSLDEAISSFEGMTTDNELAITYDYLGSYWGDMSEPKKSASYFNKAFAIRMMNKEQDALPLFISYNYLGVIEYHKNNDDEAIRLILQGVDIINENNGNYFDKAKLFFALALQFDRKHDYNSAIRYLDEALLLIKPHENDASYFRADILAALGNGYRGKEEYKKSMSYFNEALSFFEELPYHYRRGMYLHDYAILLMGIGEYEQANEKLLHAAEVFAHHNNQCGWYINQLMQIQTTIANIYIYQGSHEKTIEALLKNIEEIKKALGDKSHHLPQVYNNIGTAYNDLGQYDQAIFYYDKGIELSGGIKDDSVRDFSYVIGTINWSYLIWNKGESLLAKYKKDKKLEDLESALFLFDLSVKYIDYQRRSFHDDASKIGFATENKIVYERCIDVILNLQELAPNKKQYESAFEYFEKSRSLVLHEAFNQRNVTEFNGISSDLLEEERQIKLAAQSTENDYFDNYNKYGDQDQRTIVAKSNRFNAIKDYNNFLAKLKNEHNNYYRNKYEPNLASLQEVRRLLIKDDTTCLLAYYVGDNNAYLCYIAKEVFEIIPIEKDSLWAQRIEHFINGITAPYNTPSDTRDSYEESLSQYIESSIQLYDILMTPIQKSGLLDGMKKIIIVPDNQLAHLPFEALLKKTPDMLSNFNTYPFLIKDFQFSYAYSAALLLEMTGKQPMLKPKKQILALAPFANQETEHFGLLISSKQEVIELTTQIWQGEYKLNKEATKKFFIDHCSDFNILHFSTHGRANLLGETDAYLMFSPVSKQSDAALYTRELYSLNLNADMIVLSACEANIGEWQKGEGILSIGRGFAYAGAKSVLATLWKAEERVSKDLVVGFHRYLKQTNLPKDAALRLAKLDILNGRNNVQKHPFFWAPMIAIGDMSSIVY